MNKTALAVSGIGVGAGLYYFLHPDRGERRRARLRRQVIRLVEECGEAAERTAHQTGSQWWGLLHSLRSLARGRDTVPDEALEVRLRAKLDHLVKHPSTLEISVEDGVVTLRGPVLAEEEDELLDAVSDIRGVREIKNRLMIYESPEEARIDSIEGGMEDRNHDGPAGSRAARVVTGTAGAALALLGLRLQNRAGQSVAMLGLGLLANAIAGSDVIRLPKVHS